MKLAAASCIVACLASALGCSKDNDVDNSQHVGSGVGAQCSGPNDPGCGVAAVCVLGYCRTGCTNDGECPTGTLCIGDAPPFGCQFKDEIDCSAGKKCAPIFTCGVDGKCRMPCSETVPCPRNEHLCVADACIGNEQARTAAQACGGSDASGRQFLGCLGTTGDLRTCNVFEFGLSQDRTCTTAACINFCTSIHYPEIVGSMSIGGCMPGGMPPEGAVCSSCVAQATACQTDPGCTRCMADPGCTPNSNHAALVECAKGCQYAMQDAGVQCP